MTISEVIKQLQQFDPSLPVLVEGCSCPYAHPVRAVVSADDAYKAGVILDDVEMNSVVIRMNS